MTAGTTPMAPLPLDAVADWLERSGGARSAQVVRRGPDGTADRMLTAPAEVISAGLVDHNHQVGRGRRA